MSIDNRLGHGNFFKLSLEQWVEATIMDKFQRSSWVSWPLLFTTICTTLWQSRNLFIFENESIMANDLYHKVLRLAREYGYDMKAIENASRH